jgi:hypothetical protein
MKKLIVAILAFVYLGTATGATVNIHYCMGKLISWDFWHGGSGKCSNCGMDKAKQKKDNCCKDEIKLVKAAKDQQITEPAFQAMQVLSVALPFGSFVTSPGTLPSVTTAYPVSHAPPECSHTPLHIRNCIFLI